MDNLPAKTEKKVKPLVQEESEDQVIEALKENLLPHAKKFLKPAYEKLSEYMKGDGKTFMIREEEGHIYFINVPSKDILPMEEIIKDDSHMKVFPVQDFMEALITGDFSVFEGDEDGN